MVEGISTKRISKASEDHNQEEKICPRRQQRAQSKGWFCRNTSLITIRQEILICVCCELFRPIDLTWKEWQDVQYICEYVSNKRSAPPATLCFHGRFHALCRRALAGLHHGVDVFHLGTVGAGQLHLSLAGFGLSATLANVHHRVRCWGISEQSRRRLLIHQERKRAFSSPKQSKIER